jgi:hypothetical protein
MRWLSITITEVEADTPQEAAMYAEEFEANEYCNSWIQPADSINIAAAESLLMWAAPCSEVST